MSNSKINNKLFINFIFCFLLKLIFCTEALNSYGMKFAKTLKLYNGNIIIAGDIGIYTYDSTGMTLLYNYNVTENKIEKETDAYYTNLAQFPKKHNGLVLVFMKHIMYIFDSNGNFKFKKQPPSLSISSNNWFYTIVPYTHIDNNYHFILAYINEQLKAILQYFIINLDEESITLKFNHIFDEDDPDRSGIEYNYGISCQIMEHATYGETLTCFYQNNINQKQISAKNFKIEDDKFIVFSDLEEEYYEDSAFCIQSVVSINKKNCLVCYVQNDNDCKRNGYCSVYNIDDNQFSKNNNYLNNQCEANINHITLNYYKETKQYIFSCTYINAQIYTIIFDENFNPVEINSGSEYLTETTISIPSCHYPYFYSIIFLSNEYKILGDFVCDGDLAASTLYSIPDEYKPSEIYTDSLEEDSESKDSVESQKSTEVKESSDSQEVETSEESSEKSESEIYNSSPIIDSTDESSYNDICNGYRNSDGTICSNEVPLGYYILDLFNKILGKCHISCKSCIKGSDNYSSNCQTCNENFELNEDNNCFYKYNYYFNETINQIIYLLSNELCPDILPYEIVSTKECVENCEIEEFINKKCKINSFSENNLESITENLRKIINYINDSNTNIIINGNNIIYEIKSSNVKTDYDKTVFSKLFNDIQN